MITRPFAALVGVVVVALATAAAPTPLYGIWARDFGFSTAHLTGVFAVYAATLLLALLTCADLPLVWGHRATTLVALTGLGGAVVCFLVADGLALLYAGRAVQGAATGLATVALSAWLLDAEPRPGAGGLANGAAPTAGLAVGALLAGALTEWVAAPLRTLWVVLLAVLAASALVVARLAGPPRASTARRSWRPASVAGLDDPVRRSLLRHSPVLVATWATGGLYLSLGPSLVQALAHRSDQLLGATGAAVLTAAGAVAILACRRWPPDRALRAGLAALLAGLVVAAAAILVGSVVLFLLGTAVAGAGFGVGFTAAFRQVTSAAAPAQRPAVIAVVYTVSYTAFSVPALAAGVAARSWSLTDVALAYAAVMAVVTATAFAVHRRFERSTGPVVSAPHLRRPRRQARRAAGRLE